MLAGQFIFCVIIDDDLIKLRMAFYADVDA